MDQYEYIRTAHLVYEKSIRAGKNSFSQTPPLPPHPSPCPNLMYINPPIVKFDGLKKRIMLIDQKINKDSKNPLGMVKDPFSDYTFVLPATK